MSVIVIGFITLDGVVSGPGGSGSTPADGRAFRHRPQTSQHLQPAFPAGGPPASPECLQAQQAGAAVLARYGRAAR